MTEDEMRKSLTLHTSRDIFVSYPMTTKTLLLIFATNVSLLALTAVLAHILMWGPVTTLLIFVGLYTVYKGIAPAGRFMTPLSAHLFILQLYYPEAHALQVKLLKEKGVHSDFL